MGQIMFSRNPIGTVGLALFLLGISVFVYSVFDPVFGPLAIGSIAAGGVVATLLALRHPKTPHIDPRQVDTADDAPRPIEPR